ncbi:MAG: adenylate/guanylate cyclase domain-containing protein [Desulfurivibrio sp.]|nr:adenylate/guanylate cyclase domain-containing protein [Desulfurivibrio sp.]
MKLSLAWLRPSPFKIGCLLIIAAVLLFYSFGTDKPRLLNTLDKRLLDTMFSWRGPVPVSGEVVIVDIDENSLRELGQWPWPRDLVARLVANITAGGAAAIGLDMVFAEADRASPGRILDELRQQHPEIFVDKQLSQLRGAGGLDNDRLLGQTLARAPSVLGYVFQTRDDGLKDPAAVPFPAAAIRLEPASADFAELNLMDAYRAILNVAEISLAASEGFFNVFPGEDGIVRRVPLLMGMDGMPYPSLALEAARLGMGEEGVVIHAERAAYGGRRGILGVSLGEHFIPTDERGQLTVNFRGPAYQFPYISASEVVEGHKLERFADKIVLIGTSAAGLLDLRATPTAGVYPGVEVHASVIDNLLAGDPFTQDIYTEIAVTLLVVIVGGLLLTALLAYSGALAGGLAALALAGGLVGGNYFFFFKQQIQIGLVYPLAVIVLLFMVVTLFNYFFEGRQKRFISKAFSQYVPPELVDEMAAKPDQLGLGGDSREMTVLFSDVRGFTTISEGLEAGELTRLMNEMLTPMTRIIHRHRGTIDKYMGDAIMAFWGAPLADPEHARHALEAGLEMVAVLPDLQQRFQARGWPAIRIGVGLNTGVMSVGNMGSEFRMAYTVLGDAVNLGARLEGLTKTYGVDIMVSEYTRRQVPDFAYRELDRVRVKGKDRPVAIFEPLGPAAELEPALLRNLERYHQALELYRHRDFTAAAAILQELQQQEPERRLYAIYLERLQHFREQPPPADWDGTFTHTSK